MTVKEAQDILKEMQKNCLKDWGDDPHHYNDPKKEEKAQALQLGIWGMQLYHNINRSVDGFESLIEESNKKHILTKEERDYLAAVIKPSRNDALCLKKVMYEEGKTKKDAIQIIFDSDGSTIRTRWLPAGKVYVGMKLGYPYSPEELGL